MNKSQNTRSTSSSSQSSGFAPICSECGRRHKGVYYRATGTCFRYGKTGHVVKDCQFIYENTNRLAASLAGSTSVPRSNVRTNNGKETLRQGRVFALVPGDVQNTKSMVSGTLPICAQSAYVLIDSGSTHSFVSYVFSRKLTKPVEPMNYVLSVSTPSGDSMLCAYVYLACDVMIGDMLLYVDLMPAAIDHFDCILGMDWLTIHHARINCVAKSIVFRPPDLPEFVFCGNGAVPLSYLISTMKANRLHRKGCWGYLCCVFVVNRDSANIGNIPIVNEFPDVFPNELPGDLIDREIEFTIDVVPRTQPISKTPYRMSISKLKELKI
ncbi:uncharacterized protein LOC114297261 [Camellia sinensis]|uniref:uncharacterized protein LOC114297261 n=1 Tax=Camellia sinensis TaxID=4442 RepID=UPI001036BCB2|nr:uncharacterized protein LOC114297261 [Camellia sinensis]